MKWLLFIAIIFTAPLCAASQTSVSTSKEIATQELRLMDLINQERLKYGLAPLSRWKVLSHYARQHSQNMAKGSVSLGHAGLNSRGNQIQKIAPCHSVGENVARLYLIDDHLQKACEMWMQSPRHRANIIDDYTETGIGIAYDPEGRCYITQLFSKRAH